MTEKLEKFKEIVRKIVLLDNTRSLLLWDQETNMPPNAGKGRGDQVAQITEMLHEWATGNSYAELLMDLWSNRQQLNQRDQEFLRVKKRTFDLENKLPTDLVTELAKTAALAQQAWVRAKKEDDFNLFEPHLVQVIELNRQKAAVLNSSNDPYNTLLDTFEENLNIHQLDEIFEAIIPTTREIIQKYENKPESKLSKHVFPIEGQRYLSRFLLEEIGYNFDQGNLAEVTHPFMTRLGKKDVRVTNSYQEDHLSSLFSALHEGGHALFEQGISQDYADLLTDDERSLGVHESQSRFWENVIGRSPEFWARYYPKLQKTLGLTDDLNDFLASTNFVQPSPIRTEADEVTYNLHIFVRYELEKQLVSGKLEAKDVPEVWNNKYEKLLGIRPKSNAEGCLQDVHWSHATLGYFPTYTLGNVICAQFWQAYKNYDYSYQATLIEGNWPKILDWFRQHVHEYGPLLQTEKILEKATGERLNPRYFVEYLRSKYL